MGPAKAKVNLRSHEVDFADAATVLHDESAITISEVHEDEERFVTLGIDALGRLLVVVYTMRGDVVRLISGRKANKHERRQYEVET